MHNLNNMNTDQKYISEGEINDHKGLRNIMSDQSSNRRKKIVQLYASAYLQIQQYNLKTSIIQSCSFSKSDYEFYTQFHLQRVHRKYNQLYQKLQQIMKEIKTQFVILEANQLRSVNNILKAYKKRVGINDNNKEEATKKKKKQISCNELEQEQKWVIEQLIIDPHRYQQSATKRLSTIQQKMHSLTTKLQNQLKHQHQKTSSPSLSPFCFTKLMDILNSTSIHLNAQYEQFETKLLVINNIFQQGFQQLNQGYLNRFEQIATNRCLSEIITEREIQMERFIKDVETKQQHGLFNTHQYSLQGGYKQFDRHLDFNKSKFNPNQGGYFSNKVNKSNRHKTSMLSQHMDIYSLKRKESIQSIYGRDNENTHLSLNKEFCDSTSSKGRIIRSNKDKDGKQHKMGRMFNKKKAKAGIVMNKDKKHLYLHADWCYNIDGQQMQLSEQEFNQVNDNWRHFYIKNNKYQQQFKQEYHHHYNNQNQQYFDKEQQHVVNYPIEYYNNINYGQQYQYWTIQHILQRTYPSVGDIQSFYCYDQYGGNQSFSLIHPFSNMVQNRIIFQSTRQLEIYRKLQFINQQINQKQNKVEKYKQQLAQKENNKLLQSQTNNTWNRNIYNNKQPKQEKLPKKDIKSTQEQVQNKKLTSIVSNINITEKQLLEKNEANQCFNYTQQQKFMTQTKAKQIQTHIQLGQKVASTSLKDVSINNNNKNQMKLIQSIQQSQLQSSGIVIKQAKKGSKQIKIKQPHFQPTLLSSIIQSYFSTISQKYCRIAKQEKSLKVFYFPTLQEAHWQFVSQQIVNIQRVFIVIQSPIIILIKMEKFYTLQKQLIKSAVYQFGCQIDQQKRQYLRSKSKQQLYKEEVVTFLFKFIDLNGQQKKYYQQQNQKTKTFISKITNINSIQHQLNCNNQAQTKCLLGMLFVLIYQQKVLQKDSIYTLNDYLSKGQQLILQYKSFYFQQKENTQIQTYTNSKLLFKRVYENPNVSKINYFFKTESQQGVVFSKLVDVANLINKEEQVEVFKVNRFNGDSDREDEEENEDQDESLRQKETNQQIEQKQQQVEQKNSGTQIQQGDNKPNIEKQSKHNQVNRSIQNQQENGVKNRLKQIEQIQGKIVNSQMRDFDNIMIRRSNSRQQLKHFNSYQQSMFLIEPVTVSNNNYLNYNCYQRQRQLSQLIVTNSHYQKSEGQQWQQHQQLPIQQNQQEVMLNYCHLTEYQSQYYDQDDEYVGLE